MATRKTSPRAKRVRSREAATSDIVVPDRLFFRIGDVAELLGLPPYVLRFWETEFPALAPKKGSSGQRSYRRKDVELAIRIKQLLYEEGFTIAGARQQLKQEANPKHGQNALPFSSKSTSNGLKRVRAELKDILSILSKKR